ncbi:MAG: hypothetical protein AAGD33_23850, partial [Actinomycetota bacterium]
MRTELACIVVVGGLMAAACGSDPSVGDGVDETIAEVRAGESIATGPPSPDTVAGTDSDGDLPFGLSRCGPFELISADPSLYRDEPTYVANEMPTDEVRSWAQRQPGFEELWIDRERRGWITVGFSEGVDDRTRDLRSEFPDDGVVAVEVPFTRAELDRLADRAFDLAQQADLSIGGSGNVPRGLVSISVGVLDDETLEPFAELAGQPICFDGREPAEAVQDGPQPTEGAGWRLLGSAAGGETYRTTVATTLEQYGRLWAISGVPGDAPDIDLADEIVIWFGAVYGSGCPIRLDDVIVDIERAVVHGEFVLPGNPTACPDDANPEAYVVALDRSELPTGPFIVQLDAEDPPPGAPEERTVVAVDLSEPRSTATDDEIGFDPALFERAGSPLPLGPGSITENGIPGEYRVPPGCSLDVVGPLNTTLWVPASGSLDADPPASWAETIDAARADGESFVVSVEVRIDPPTLLVEMIGHSETY